MAKWEMPDLSTPLTMVKDFADAMGQPRNQTWCVSDDPTEENLDSFRGRLILEELEEFRQEDKDEAAALKELADIIYVCYGCAVTFGWDLDEAVRRVHASNMSKLGDDGKPIYREDGKVLKGPNYKKPNLEDLVNK